ncbi:carbonic anhydrase [Nocardia sp. CA-129566]|uniref:carbonic anhydrase n=1 Tax=Nocardia sp. CA-129566 TaxID=3239976 RepID=UPI003D9796D7
MTAVAERHDLRGTPAIAEWLEHVDATDSAAKGAEPDDRVSMLVRSNVVAQLANLSTHPSVSRAVNAGTVNVEGWVFDIGTGAVTVFDAAGSEVAPAA